MYKFPFLDFDKLNNEMASLKVPAYKKLGFMYERMGGLFHDEPKRILKGAQVAIVGVGGLPVQVIDDKYAIIGHKHTLLEIKEELYKMAGLSAGMSYANPYNKTLNELADKTLSLGHTSILHTLNLNILIVGLTIGVEHEFSSQRDMVHLSRLTVAKTAAQKQPCLVLRDEKYIDIYSEILNNTDSRLKDLDESKDWETINLLYPTAKASTLMISGTFKNILKLVALKDSDGKEDEFIDVLEKIDSAISWLK